MRGTRGDKSCGKVRALEMETRDVEMMAVASPGTAAFSHVAAQPSSNNAPSLSTNSSILAFEIEGAGGGDGGSEDEVDEDDEDEDEDDSWSKKAEDDLIGESIVRELLRAIYEARYLGPALALLGLLISYQLTIAPYQQNVTDYSLRDVDLKKIRPVLTKLEQAVIRMDLMNAETELSLPLPSYDTIKLRFHAAAVTKATHQPPEMFYRGVTFGISNTNSHDLEYTSAQETLYTNMYRDLKTMRPSPTSVMARKAQCNESGWHDTGYAVYFSYADLAKQGKLSSDKLQPWKRVLEDVLVIARNYRQVCVIAWYPHEFGEVKKTSPIADTDEDVVLHGTNADTDEDGDLHILSIPDKGDEAGADSENGATTAKIGKRSVQSQRSPAHWNDDHMYKTVLQHIIPTRTGLTGLISIVPVWMSAVNATPPREHSPTSDVYIMEWDEEDHWHHYKPGGIKHIPELEGTMPPILESTYLSKANNDRNGEEL